MFVSLLYPNRTKTRHFGRNGSVAGAGIAVETWGGDVQLIGINSRGRGPGSGNIRISIPADRTEIDRIIAALNQAKDKLP